MKITSLLLAFLTSSFFLVAADPTPASTTPDPTTSTPDPAPATSTQNDIARFLAGLPPSPNTPLAKLSQSPAWQEHAHFFDTAWASLEKRQLSHIRTWSATHLTAPNPTCIYFFSGPDYLYANAFFPKASTSILCGLEPIGHLPDPTKLTKLAPSLQGLQKSLNTLLSFSFFKTKDMQTELHSHQLDGTIPILYVFLARSGKIIDSASLTYLSTDGTPSDTPTKNSTPGVKIIFSSPDQPPQTLYYFTSDLSNSGVAKSGLLKFTAAFPHADSLLKSASFLLHLDSFSSTRQFLLTHSATITQDDSGIPIAAFDPALWSLTPFGKYLGPITIFKEFQQPKLQELFDSTNPTPLPFGIGYRWASAQSNWLLATKK